MSIEFRRFDPYLTRDLRTEALTARGRLKVLPASFYASTSVEERAVFGARTAAYVLPTTELVEWLRRFIGGRSALEIGAGNGVLAEALGITAADSCMQRRPEIAAYYRALQQPVVQYGANVQERDAQAAVRHYKPKVVVAAWVTHKYEADRHDAGGNQDGVAEEDVIAQCESYVFIGNRHVHRGKSIWKLPHVSFEPPWLYSRAHNGSPDFIAVWGRVPGPLADV
ncbi:hypothetical protein [Ramlibacter alkalitolerans]|uniref:Class I SAM-dependent methyltransferase n=1 Tax=Ramlibacter alkalitolerans TaxID=2039631 RepID=A0ABS1JV02_9BURK|nr:hypothetical protein [Ramlibacter alkalitolerans]MBL0427711.1 hypothetical protein [Ramlibacter alkalitolerans]